MEVLEAMTAPTVDGQTSLPKRSGPKGLLPSTWLARTLRVSYVDCYGGGPPRGNLEGTLRYLASLRAATVVAEDAEGSDAA